jgi:hypothetical protein
LDDALVEQKSGCQFLQKAGGAGEANPGLAIYGQIHIGFGDNSTGGIFQAVVVVSGKLNGLIRKRLHRIFLIFCARPTN